MSPKLGTQNVCVLTTACGEAVQLSSSSPSPSSHRPLTRTTRPPRATLRCFRPPAAAPGRPRPTPATLAPATRLHLGRRQHGLRLQLEQRLERLEQRPAREAAAVALAGTHAA